MTNTSGPKKWLSGWLCAMPAGMSQISNFSKAVDISITCMLSNKKIIECMLQQKFYL